MNLVRMIEHLQESGKVHFRDGDVKKAIEKLDKKGYEVHYDSSNDCLVLDNIREVKTTSKRVQLTLSEELDSQLKEMGDEMGVGKCGLIRVAIKFYLDYHEGLKNASKLPEMLKVLKELNDSKK